MCLRVLTILGVGVAVVAATAEAETSSHRARVFARARERTMRELKIPAWRTELRRKLETTRITVEFEETPFAEAITTVAAKVGISCVIDPRVREAHDNTFVCLRVSDMPGASALTWICRLADTEWDLIDHALLVRLVESRGCEILLRVYDVRDLVPDSPDYTAPCPDRLFCGTSPRIVPIEDDQQRFHASHVADSIMGNVDPGGWAAELGTSIEERDGKLVIMQSPAVHRQVVRFLDEFRDRQMRQVRVTARVVSVSEQLLATIAGMSAPGAHGIHMSDGQLKLLADALSGGIDARTLRVAEVCCASSQCVHVLDGERVPPNEIDGPDSRPFRGLLFEARPTVCGRDTHVRADVRISLDVDRPNGNVGVWRLNTTVRCVDGDTVMLGGATGTCVGGQQGRRLVALVTPTVLHLSPAGVPSSPEIDG